MTFDPAALRAQIARHGPLVRVVVAGVEGSAPREVGASMLVWGGPLAEDGLAQDGLAQDGLAGTIGGGALEFAAVAGARAMLAAGIRRRLTRVALGPTLGQCCGGAVRLLSEIWDSAALDQIGEPVLARPVTPGAETGAETGDGGAMPLAVRRMLAQARAAGVLPAPGLIDGWMVEPVAQPARALWVWGAGHVGRALVSVLAPLPGLAITWVDVDATRFPTPLPGPPQGVTQLMAANPADLVAYAPPLTEHLIVTYSHALDLELCHRLLARGFVSAGLIGSSTKWARFRGRLRALGHSDAAIGRITCPIGDPGLGKHPQAIAIGVAAGLLAHRLGQSAKVQAL